MGDVVVAGDFDALVSGDDIGGGIRPPPELLAVYEFIYICIDLLSIELA